MCMHCDEQMSEFSLIMRHNFSSESMKNLTKTQYTKIRKAINAEISCGAASLKEAYYMQVSLFPNQNKGSETEINVSRLFLER